jgi:hypothetical protein
VKKKPPFRPGPLVHFDDPPLAKSPFKRRYSHRDVFRIDTTTDSDRSRIQSPSLKFKTEVAPIPSFRRVLKLLDRCGFDWVRSYHGPPLGIEADPDKLPSIEHIDKTLATAKDKRVPFGGLSAVLVYKNYQRIRATVKVSGKDLTKVKIKVKGPVMKADWKEFRRLVKKRFDVEL